MQDIFMAFKQGGWFMYLILTFALLGLAIIIERMIVIMFMLPIATMPMVSPNAHNTLSAPEMIFKIPAAVGFQVFCVFASIQAS